MSIRSEGPPSLPPPTETLVVGQDGEVLLALDGSVTVSGIDAYWTAPPSAALMVTSRVWVAAVDVPAAQWEMLSKSLKTKSREQLKEALQQFNRSLQLNPSNAPIIYNHRARVYQYQNQLELAEEELQKGLTLEPRHPLLRTSVAYQRMRQGDMQQAISILEAVIKADESMRIAFPTLALCYLQVGQRERATALIEEDSLSAAEADSEMAYRLATYFAVEGDESEALHWLRRAIYLGNENYPWFSKNPAWNNLHGRADFERILEDLKKSHKVNQKTWRRLLERVPAEKLS